MYCVHIKSLNTIFSLRQQWIKKCMPSFCHPFKRESSKITASFTLANFYFLWLDNCSINMFQIKFVLLKHMYYMKYIHISELFWFLDKIVWHIILQKLASTQALQLFYYYPFDFCFCLADIGKHNKSVQSYKPNMLGLF